ncbi:MAG: hypothetical protein RIA71_09095 [Oceanicaulis sp.]
MILALLLSTSAFVSAPTAAEAQCGAPPGAAALLAETEGRVLVIGELHGTNEAPALAGSVVCLALSQGERVALGLELSADEQASLDGYMASDGGMTARAALLDDEYWMSEVQDGRRSHAMMRLIETARGWQAAGLPAEVQALDAGEADADLADDPATQRDRAMLRRALAARDRADRVIVLVGNVHSRRTAYTFGDQRIETLGTLSAPGDLALLNTLYGAGEAWNCTMPDGQLVCGAREVWPGPVNGDPRVLTPEEAEALSDPSAYDYFVYLGPASVSPPAAGAP